MWGDEPMTPRCYWDAFDNLWERRHYCDGGPDLAYLLWSPAGPIIGTNAHGRWSYIAARMGPMVAAA
jgi:hypothetical protein